MDYLTWAELSKRKINPASRIMGGDVSSNINSASNPYELDIGKNEYGNY